ncbi:cellulose binding domain-containing protein [Saccharothrix violaceirubra]|uniref:Parallel beta helix pectate lyase-like protein n=1 Tax=Saccharothrix violaceirubra TaxID=413306 RepID=A0A7W7T255_9PSEU|nr:cellulose binding domain-containing protein [Saccharothrix violaceirubra]MBB4965189.1 hypothetical protein [Saccharothrix violaceirubra]
MRKRLAVLATAGICVAAVTTSGASTPAAPTAEFERKSVWSTGYGGQYTLVNSGDTDLADWVVEFDLPPGTTVLRAWSSTFTTDGRHYRFTGTGYNDTVRAGTSTTFGFTSQGLGLPLNCRVDGVACDSSAPLPDTRPPEAPAGLVVTGASIGSVSLSWNPATDDVGVVDYRVSVGDVEVTTTSTTGVVVDGLSPGTGYRISVRARDAAGHTSEPGVLAVATAPALSTVDVRTADGLRAALAGAEPGTAIRLAPGVYRGPFAITRPGRAEAPITLSGPPTAVLVGAVEAAQGDCPSPDRDAGYGVWVYEAPWWNLSGFTVRDAKKGVVVDRSPHTVLDGLSVHHIAEEGVHFRGSSADGVLRSSTITDTGLGQPGYGEGVYVGSAASNWGCHGTVDGVDRSDRVRVLGNRVGPRVAAEAVDVKEGTSGGVIRGNVFDGTGISGQNSADSWVDVKGYDYLVEENTGSFASPGTFANGYETHNPVTVPAFPNGCGIVWRGNRSDLGGVGRYAIKITSVSKCAERANVVHASNTVERAVTGLTNVGVTP